jgi:hypothetical protein
MNYLDLGFVVTLVCAFTDVEESSSQGVNAGSAKQKLILQTKRLSILS